MIQFFRNNTLMDGSLWSATAALLLACLQVGSASAVQLEDSSTFVPDRLNYFNPLKRDAYQDSHDETSSVTYTNYQLENAAEQIRTNNMSAQQRALNHQWLEQKHYNDDLYVGSKVFSKLMKMGLRTYWDGLRSKHYSTAKALPNGDGTGSVTEDVEYNVRVSGDKIKLSLEYEF